MPRIAERNHALGAMSLLSDAASMFCLKASQISALKSAYKSTEMKKRLGMGETVTHAELVGRLGCGLYFGSGRFWMKVLEVEQLPRAVF